MKTIRTDRAREAFLTVLRQTCNVSEAARAANFGRSAAYVWRREDSDFAAAWDDAEQEAADRLEREAWRRAVEGVDEPITHQGIITGTYKKYSDRMLEILLKAHRPKKFVEKQLVGSDPENPLPTGFVVNLRKVDDAQAG